MMKLVLLLLFVATPLLVKASPTYDQLHPYYAEFCAVTQLTPMEGEKGGIGGHGVLFLKGACREVSLGYPRLKVCDSQMNMSKSESGVSISVDKMFKNANWVASDGKDFIITGGVKPNQPVDTLAEDRVVQKILSQGLLNGIAVHEDYLKDKPAGLSDQEFVARQTLSTDFALSFGRNVLCARMPIKKNMLPAMVEYLNSRNDEYRGANEYHWSGIFNNCTHTTHNAFAAAGIMRNLGTDKFAPLQIFNLAIPSNQYINLMRLGNDTSLLDVVSFYNDSYKRRLLMENDWMAVQPGVLAENVMRHDFQNSRYKDVESNFLVEDVPVINFKKQQLKHILKDARYLDLRANLLEFQAKYRKALKKKMSLDRLRDDGDLNRDHELDTPEFGQFYEKFYSHIENALRDVDSQLAAF